MVDEVEGREFDVVGSPRFSPDSKRVAYIAYRSAENSYKEFVVVNGIAGREYETISNLDDAPVFSPDSKHVVYAARRGEKHFIVVDGVEGKKYDIVYNDLGIEDKITFHNSATFHTMVIKGNELFRVEIKIQE